MTAPAPADVQAEQLQAEQRTTVLDVVVPVYNEETDLGPSVRRLVAYLRAEVPYPFRVTIADNASADGTPLVAAGLAGEFAEVRVATLAEKGRGRALREVWTDSDAAVLAYMDVDLSTDLRALLPLVAPLITGHSDVAIGSRLARGSRVVRGAKRQIISRGYNLLLKGTLAASFSDAQCGFKAIRADAARELLPHVRDTGWFFDTELLVLAQNAGMRIHEVPVDWVDDPDSRVDIVSTVVADLKGIARMARTLLTGKVPQPPTPAQAGLLGQLLRFAIIGVGSTIAYLALFAFARPALGAQAANVLALLVTAIANTAVNRRLTFGVRGSAHALRHQAQGLLIFALGLLLTSGALAVIGSTHSAAVEMATLVGANLAATVLRFGLLKVWVFRTP
ncbi:MAG: bifunctional glycosyltransferase family 2/GtrA family protein [Catenulispora sp.]|nr:bifunctional glycosyltransferase family 2/GtrA family protein [Catenulispora sp.]